MEIACILAHKGLGIFIFCSFSIRCNVALFDLRHYISEMISFGNLVLGLALVSSSQVSK